MFQKSKKYQRGFTLVEVTATLGLTVLLASLLFGVYLTSQRAFSRGDSTLELAQNGRVFLDRLTRELRQTPDIATSLPATPDISGFPPATELEFQNGHDASDIEYIRYYMDGSLLKRQLIRYYFSSQPTTNVYWDSLDQFSNSPASEILSETTVAEYISDLGFYGGRLVYVDAEFFKKDINFHIFTAIWGRNSR